MSLVNETLGSETETRARCLRKDLATVSRPRRRDRDNIPGSIIQKMAFAVLEALKRFKVFICGHELLVVNDYNPSSYLTTSASNSAKLLRWLLALQSFDVEFHY
jgi:RNase H-like domain found in reverse transcriptase